MGERARTRRTGAAAQAVRATARTIRAATLAIRASALSVAAFGIAAACGLAAPALAATPTPAAASSKVPRCETITVKGQRWGVYIAKGKADCTTAGTVLKGVLAGKGKDLDNGSSANSYIRYDGWVCPYDQMGIVTCEYGTMPVANSSRQIFGLSCASGVGEPACPARGES
jgi:hypothetical protein